MIVEAYSYFFAEGDGQNWTKGSAKALDFTVKRTVDDSTSYSHFTGLKIDGKTVAASQYSAQSGSVKLTLSSTLLETLSVGEHKRFFKLVAGLQNLLDFNVVLFLISGQKIRNVKVV